MSVRGTEGAQKPELRDPQGDFTLPPSPRNHSENLCVGGEGPLGQSETGRYRPLEELYTRPARIDEDKRGDRENFRMGDALTGEQPVAVIAEQGRR